MQVSENSYLLIQLLKQLRIIIRGLQTSKSERNFLDEDSYLIAKGKLTLLLFELLDKPLSEVIKLYFRKPLD